ncbi:MAG: DUF4317 domain-containing protein [Acetatifactor sp.]|nr:DUF4317 domain-containing protein [Acetatifactor sp.]
MYKNEVSEIKKLFTPKNCAITRICGCYVDGEKNKKATFKEPFLSLPEEDMFKYFEIFRKSLSGQQGKNQLNLEFPLSTEMEGGTQSFLLALRDSKLKDDSYLEQFYDRIIENYDYVGNYLILVIHDAYDVPGKTKDGIEMEDASDEVYEYILTTICPVNLSKPGLSYNAEENNFTNRLRDWVVDMPDKAFLFPAFNDRRTDIHSLLYYSKDAELLGSNFAMSLLGCELPLSAGNQKDTFTAIIENTLEETCSIEAVKNIHEKLNEMVEEHKDELEPLSLDKNEVKKLLAGSGVSNEKLEKFDEHFVEDAGDDTTLLASNVMNRKSFDVKTPDVVIKVKGDKTNLLQTKVIDGREYLVIALEGEVEVNGITIRKNSENEEEEL